MKRSQANLLYWAPRILGAAFVAFLSLFSLDAFQSGSGPMGILGWLVHMIPVLVVLAALAAGWRWPRVGAVLFALLGVAYLVFAWGLFPAVAYVAISGPLFLISILFFLNGVWRDEVRAARAGPTRDPGTSTTS